MRRRRKRRHVESGPAELATAVLNGDLNGSMGRGRSGIGTDLMWMASQWEDDTFPSYE
jgi:hypothetical protein